MLSSPLPSVACPDNFIVKDLKAQEQLQYNKKTAYLLNKVLNNDNTKVNNNNERGPSHIFGKLYSLISDNTRESQYKKYEWEKITCVSVTNQLCYLPNSKYVSLH